ncbi:MAG: ATP phosphoribosyltransferase [uncultured bacterium]|nr:MAG: ATP phosphoribosyltransferase [uncultured bacterium]HBH17563.1 ATP phosphoribosyltransferase [Cyanobacteria bacterium UBA9579]
MNGLKIAIPNKGRLSDDIFDLLQRAGLTITKKERSLYASTHDGNYTVIFVRTQDIPNFVQDGVTDLGITGYDVVQETEAEVETILDLNFGHCKMVIATKEEAPYNSPDDIPDGAKIATSFPNLTKRFFDKLGKNVHITEVSGATEVTPQLGLADIIVDITSSGTTLKVNKLKIIGEILCSQSVVIARPDVLKNEENQVKAFVRAIKSAMDAEEKKYLMANIPKASLDEIKNFLPGLNAPTIIGLLGNEDMVAIHVVVEKKQIYDSIDKLKQLGATGILIMTVDQMIP